MRVNFSFVFVFVLAAVMLFGSAQVYGQRTKVEWSDGTYGPQGWYQKVYLDGTWLELRYWEGSRWSESLLLDDGGRMQRIPAPPAPRSTPATTPTVARATTPVTPMERNQSITPPSVVATPPRAHNGQLPPLPTRQKWGGDPPGWKRYPPAQVHQMRINQFLAKYGNVVDDSGFTLLHWAAHNAYGNWVFRHLVQRLDVNDRDNVWDASPLWLAVDSGCKIEVIQILVSNGADPNLESVNGQTPLELARQRGNTSLVRYLASVRR